jgi:ABC-type polysaccharide/polyol phosphate export permease
MNGIFEFFCLNKKFLVWNLTLRNLKIKYRRSVLGYLWSLLVPLSQAAVFYVVFKLIIKVNVPNFIPYIVSGVLFWSFFSNTLAFGMEGVVGNRALLTKIPIPLQVFPFVEALSNLTALVLAIPVLVLVMALSDVPFSAANLFIFYYIGAAFFIAYGIANVLAVLLVVFADLKYIFSLLIQLWMYATPIFYDVKMIPDGFRCVLNLNPVGRVFTGVHAAIIDGSIPPRGDFIFPAVWAVISLTAGYLALRTGRRVGIVELL